MREVPRYLHNHEAVVSAFGYWPSFHDPPVLAFEQTADSVTLALHAWDMTSQVDAEGFFILQKHHRVHFIFRDVTEADVAAFISPNILSDLGFSPLAEFEAAGWFTVVLDSAMGGDLCGSFSARSGEVAAVIPCDEHGQPV